MRKLLVVVAGAVMVAACSSSSAPGSSGPPGIHWTGAAAARNGAAGPINVTNVCGSSTDTYLLELEHHSPTALKVLQEWGDVNPGGHQVLVSGTVNAVNMGPGDLPIDHPLGDDLSMDVTVDSQFKSFSQKLGTADSDTAPGDLHVEISSGFIPHVTRPSSTTAAQQGQQWPDLSSFNMTGFQPGFTHPEPGDKVLVAGRYIVDCGHPDFHTELHPISFLAWTHTTGSTTVVHFYANSYRDTEYYNTDATLVGAVRNPGRMSDPHTSRFPQYLISQVGRLLGGQIQQLQAFELVGNVVPPTAAWQVCAPGSGSAHVAYDVYQRPGVKVSITQGSSGCAAVSVAIPPGYSGPDITTRTCVAQWAYISKVAGQALAGNFDARKLINGFLPAQDAPLVDRDPVVGCADALSGPTVSPSPSGTQIRTDGSQPFPVYGTLLISRG